MVTEQILKWDEELALRRRKAWTRDGRHVSSLHVATLDGTEVLVGKLSEKPIPFYRHEEVVAVEDHYWRRGGLGNHGGDDLINEKPAALDEPWTEQRQRARKFTRDGWNFTSVVSKPEFGLCSDGSCYRCRLVTVLADTEELFNLNGNRKEPHMDEIELTGSARRLESSDLITLLTENGIPMQVRPFELPEAVVEVKDSGEKITHNLTDVDAKTLDQMCRMFRSMIFVHAQKVDPNLTGLRRQMVEDQINRELGVTASESDQ